ncbi:MAG: hypothetical protein WCX73_05615 [Candidatus Pacearchaeota archaeon]
MEKKERQKLIKSLDLMNGFPEWKIPCSCPKGGMYEEGSICSKCGGSEWIVNPELVALFEKELDKAREEGCKDDVEIFMEFLRGHSLVKDVHFYRGDGEREIIIKLN